MAANLGRLPREVDTLSWRLKMNGDLLLAESGWRGKKQQRNCGVCMWVWRLSAPG